MKIAVLLACHNRVNKTLSCLAALYACKLDSLSLSVYLVDDGSKDGTSEAVQENYPEVHLLQGDGNLFWNRGMHKAWEEAAKSTYDFYLWLNDDTLLNENALLIMLDAAKQMNHSAIICGATSDPLDTEQVTYSGYRVDGQKLKPNGTMQECFWFNGNCVLVPQSVFFVVGNLDLHFSHSMGDLDYGIRARTKGIKAYVAKETIGTCEQHSILPAWRRPSVSLGKRFKALYSPLGCNPFEFIVFDRRRSGIAMACIHFATIHLRMLFPRVFK